MPKAQRPAQVGDRIRVLLPGQTTDNKEGAIASISPGGFILTVKLDDPQEDELELTKSEIVLLVDVD